MLTLPQASDVLISAGGTEPAFNQPPPLSGEGGLLMTTAQGSEVQPAGKEGAIKAEGETESCPFALLPFSP